MSGSRSVFVAALGFGWAALSPRPCPSATAVPQADTALARADTALASGNALPLAVAGEAGLGNAERTSYPTSAGPIEVRWEPTSPTDGTVLAVSVTAASREADDPLALDEVSVSAELDGRVVRMGRLPGGWFGLVALPADRAGPAELVVSIATADSAFVERWTVHVRPRSYATTELQVAPRFTSPPAEVLERIERERDLVRATLRGVSPQWLIDGNFVRPRNTRITSPFGQKRVFNGEVQSRHWGVDLAGDVGEPVTVAGRGRVMIARELYYAGNAVYVDHGLGVFSGYYHLSEIAINEGDIVERGQVIGSVGATGRVTGPHLHWSFFVNAERLDAGSLLEIRVPEAALTDAPGEP